jgi:serine/threonine-protein kinase PpkA
MKSRWLIACVFLFAVLFVGVGAIGTETKTLQPDHLPQSDSGNPEALVEKAPETPMTKPTVGEDNPEAASPPTADTETVEAYPEAIGSGSPGTSISTTQVSPAAEQAGDDVGRALTILCSGNGVCREKLTGLPFRVLPRSFSNVYKNKNAVNEEIAVGNVRAFYPMYVFARDDIDFSDPANPMGWYHVAPSVQGPPIGWMQARDVLEWKQALIVSYTHPGSGDEERKRVLMFRDHLDLEQVVESESREQLALTLYQMIEGGKVPNAVISKEPERFVDISTTFYVLPIIDFKTISIDGDDARYLQLVAAVPRERGADTLGDPEFFKEAQQTGKLEGTAAQELDIDIVFVMDMTRSMQPFIDHTKQALAELARSVANEKVKQKVRFGLVGYRDDVSKIAALEFTSKNFTPELVGVERFVELLEKKAKATTFGSVDYSEEVLAGLEMGLASAWGEGSLRFIYLVGDASGHEVGHEQNTTGKDVDIMRLAARDANVHILVMHLLDPRMPSDHDKAKKQFMTLSKIEGSEESALVQIKASDEDTFNEAIRKTVSVAYDTIARGQNTTGTITETKAETGTGGQDKGDDVEAQKKMDKLMSSALVEYLGREANPPKDITAWVVDRDLTDPAIRSLDVRVLVNKAQLSDLINAIDTVTKALARAEVSQLQFFEALQGVTSQTMKNPGAIDVANRLADAGLLPSFIQSLPYKSEILELTDQRYASFTAEQRSTLERSLRAKLQQYRDINEQVDGWIKLNETDPEASKVYPLLLDYLP